MYKRPGLLMAVMAVLVPLTGRAEVDPALTGLSAGGGDATSVFFSPAAITRLDQAELLILSSRISYELVQKSARARIPIILAHSRPTALAVELAARLNITLASMDDDDAGLYVFCGEERFVG